MSSPNVLLFNIQFTGEQVWPHFLNDGRQTPHAENSLSTRRRTQKLLTRSHSTALLNEFSFADLFAVVLATPCSFNRCAQRNFSVSQRECSTKEFRDLRPISYILAQYCSTRNTLVVHELQYYFLLLRCGVANIFINADLTRSKVYCRTVHTYLNGELSPCMHN
jgi:hypothetical protein